VTLRYSSSFILFVLLSACSTNNKPKEEEPVVPKPLPEIPGLDYTVTKAYPHDTVSYTQGLLIYNKQFYESTGSPMQMKQTKSVFGILDTITGKIKVKAELDRNKYFGEGLTILNNKIYQITWQNQTGFIYDAKTFKLIRQFTFPNKEGWGLTTDGSYLIMSDGTNKLTYFDPTNLAVIKTVEVTRNGYVEDFLNELEFIEGFIYANVYQKNYIVRIDPATGNITGILDLSALVYKARQKYANAEVLNGIAYDSISKKTYVTGKLWSEMYQIEIRN
jgi:glutamine cyclotransferase